MKRILTLTLTALILGISSFHPAAPEWTEAELPHAYCYALGAQPANCLPRIEPEASTSSVPTPALPSATPIRTPIPITATPAPPPEPVEGLTNGDFESGILGWQTVNASGQAVGEVYHAVFHDGNTSLMFIDHFRCWRRGVYQTVAVTPLTRYRLSAWGRTWAGSMQGLDLTKPSDTSVNDWLAAGIDANGGVDYTASAVNWSQNTATENWTSANVVSTALSQQLTVFILLNLGVNGPPGQPGAACEWALATLAGWLDQTTLEILP